jgi:hypothetical protein
VRVLRLRSGSERGLCAVIQTTEWSGVGGDLGSEGALADGETQHPAADPPLRGADHGCIEISGGVEMQRAGRVEAEHTVGDAAVQVGVERRAETLHETDGAEASIRTGLGALAEAWGNVGLHDNINRVIVLFTC